METNPAPNLAFSIVQALVLYGLAEFQSGHATHLTVEARGGTFRVADNGRGHAISRTVEGAPYLNFIYTQLDYPFAVAEAKPIQLHGIGMSLLNRLCAALTVQVHKPDEQLIMAFAHGALVHYERQERPSGHSGTEISGQVNSQYDDRPVDEDALQGWLIRLLATSPALLLTFNGRRLHRAGGE